MMCSSCARIARSRALYARNRPCPARGGWSVSRIEFFWVRCLASLRCPHARAARHQVAVAAGAAPATVDRAGPQLREGRAAYRVAAAELLAQAAARVLVVARAQVERRALAVRLELGKVAAEAQALAVPAELAALARAARRPRATPVRVAALPVEHPRAARAGTAAALLAKTVAQDPAAVLAAAARLPLAVGVPAAAA